MTTAGDLGKMLGVEEAAELFGVSIWTIRRWIRLRRVGTFKFGKRVMISENEVVRVLRQSERPARVA